MVASRSLRLSFNQPVPPHGHRVMRGSPRSGKRKSPPPFSETHRAALSAARSGRSPSIETRKKISIANSGRAPSQEARAKISASLTGRKYPPRSAATRARMGAAKRGQVVSVAQRRAISLALTGRPRSAESIAKSAAKNRGRHHTPEAIAKMKVARRVAGEAGRINVPPSRSYTTLARTLHQYLASTSGLVLEPEVRFGRFTVDLYDRNDHVAYEANGIYWHALNEARDPGYHERRDNYLREVHGLRVVRFTDKEIRAMSAPKAA